MQPSALRALEFDRIVEAVRELRADADGRRASGARSRRRPMPQQVAQLLAATTETVRFIAAPRPVSAARLERPAADPRGARRRRARRSSRCGCWRSPTFLDSMDESRAAIRRAPGSFPLLEAASGGAASFKGETGAGAREDRPVRRRRRSREPGAARLIRDRLRKQRTRLRSTLESYLRGKETAKYLQDQVVTERNGRYVLRGEGRAPQRAFRASCTARRPAAPACFSSRSAPSRSTTTSSRSKSRRPKKCGASCWR